MQGVIENFSHTEMLRFPKTQTAHGKLAAPGVPFRTAEEAWFWFICSVEAREEGARPTRARAEVQRPCEPIDIYRVLERLYRNRRLRFEHMRVLNAYGRRRTAPELHRRGEAKAHQLWREAMKELDASLQRRGLVRNVFQREEA